MNDQRFWCCCCPQVNGNVVSMECAVKTNHHCIIGQTNKQTNKQTNDNKANPREGIKQNLHEIRGLALLFSSSLGCHCCCWSLLVVVSNMCTSSSSSSSSSFKQDKALSVICKLSSWSGRKTNQNYHWATEATNNHIINNNNINNNKNGLWVLLCLSPIAHTCAVRQG